MNFSNFWNFLKYQNLRCVLCKTKKLYLKNYVVVIKKVVLPILKIKTVVNF